MSPNSDSEAPRPAAPPAPAVQSSDLVPSRSETPPNGERENVASVNHHGKSPESDDPQRSVSVPDAPVSDTRPTQPSDDADNLAKEIQKMLDSTKTVRGIAKSGQSALRDAQVLYIERIVADAIYQANAGNDDAVIEKHVKAAMSSYSPAPTSVVQVLEPFAGVVAGAGASQALTLILVQDSRSTFAIALTMVLVIVGFVILAAAVTRRIVKR